MVMGTHRVNRVFFLLVMLPIMLALALSLAACQNTDTIGGPLPTLVTAWPSDGDAAIGIDGYPLLTPAPVTASTQVSGSLANQSGIQSGGSSDVQSAVQSGGRSAAQDVTLDDEPLTVLPDPASIGDDQPVSRALTAKMLALTFNDISTIDVMDYEITFSDVAPDAWYAKYINAVFVQGMMSGAGAVFLPDDPLTLGQAHNLLTQLDPAYKPSIVLTAANRDRPVSYALWVALYKKILESASDGKTIYETFGIEGANIIPLSTAGNNTTLTEGQLIADTGAFSHKGIDMDAYVDKEIRVFYKNKEIIALVSMVNESPILQNAYLIEADEQGVSIFCGGARKFYPYGANYPAEARISAAKVSAAKVPEAKASEAKVSADLRGVSSTANNTIGAICDIHLVNGAIAAIAVCTDTLTGTVLKTTQDTIEFKEYGILPLDAHFKTYSVADGALKWKSLNNLLVGADMASFYIQDGTLRAGVITDTAKPGQVRVAIGASNYVGLVHKTVTVTSDAPFTVSAGNASFTYAAGQRFTVSDIENTDLLGWPRVFIQSSNPDGTLILSGLKRNWPDNASPRYRGVIEIAREEGGYSVVNELDLEAYLYAVVPSEMPSSYGAEAAKAQAIAARSYAYNQFYQNRFHAYGGNVDDSVSSQVYNNIPENDVSIEAVDATRGQCLTYKGSVITANFFSTSAGMTANNGEVWASAGRFPTQSGAYLKAVPQYIQSNQTAQSVQTAQTAQTTQANQAAQDTQNVQSAQSTQAAQTTQSNNNTYIDLTKEENATAFFKDRTIEAYDSDFSWFRWQVRMTAAELTASINKAIAARYAAMPSLIKTQQPNGTFRSRPIDSIGTLTDISVTRRGAGGNIMELCVTGTEVTVLIATEYNVRALLSPSKQRDGGSDIILQRADGTTVTNYALMPSAFFVMDKETDENGGLLSITFYGGGMGHGVGMSQNGVKGMTDRGFTFEEALYHFYPGTEITLMYQ